MIVVCIRGLVLRLSHAIDEMMIDKVYALFMDIYCRHRR
jgi:hypothetical protein